MRPDKKDCPSVFRWSKHNKYLCSLCWVCTQKGFLQLSGYLQVNCVRRYLQVILDVMSRDGNVSLKPSLDWNWETSSHCGVQMIDCRYFKEKNIIICGMFLDYDVAFFDCMKHLFLWNLMLSGCSSVLQCWIKAEIIIKCC